MALREQLLELGLYGIRDLFRDYPIAWLIEALEETRATIKRGAPIRNPAGFFKWLLLKRLEEEERGR